MMRGQKLTLVAVVGTVLGTLVIGCPKPLPPPLVTKLPVATFMVHDSPEVTQDGMTVSIAPITEQTQRGFPQVYKTFNFTETTQDSMTGKTVQVQKQAAGAIVPLPAFQVRIVNSTGHVIRFSTAVFRLQDNTGKTYPTFASTAELLAWLDAGYKAAIQDPSVQAQLLQQSSAAVNTLQLLDRNRELLKGDEWSGYLVFNTDTATPEKMQAFMNSTERLTLRIAEVPTETNDAGQVTKTTEFTFVLDKTTEDVDAECPGDTTNPSWDVCKAKQ